VRFKLHGRIFIRLTRKFKEVIALGDVGWLASWLAWSADIPVRYGFDFAEKADRNVRAPKKLFEVTWQHLSQILRLLCLQISRVCRTFFHEKLPV
jgi:hypothetical protein